MRFKLGKSKEKPGKDKVDVAIKDIAAERIEKMEQRIYGRARDLEEKAQQIQGLTDKTEDVDARPHGPIGELTLEAADKSSDVMRVVKLNDSADADEDEDEGTVKLVEVSAVNAPPPVKAAPVKAAEAKASPAKPPEAAKEAKPDDDSDSLGNLFNQQEEEINPLANLINSLPDVTVEELIDDLKDIKRIIKEWQAK
jgi:hypothetical protein